VMEELAMPVSAKQRGFFLPKGWAPHPVVPENRS